MRFECWDMKIEYSLNQTWPICSLFVCLLGFPLRNLRKILESYVIVFLFIYFLCVCYLFSHVKLIFVFFLVLKKWIFFFLGVFVWRYHWIRRKKKLLFTLLRGWVSACNWFIYFLISTACSWFISVMFLNFHIFFSSFYSYLFLRYLYSY